jgi:hypothetical protein
VGDGSAGVPAARTAAPKLIVFRRVRFEGATLRTLTLRDDGSFTLDVPGGGAGGAFYDGRVTPATLRAVRRDIARTPWRHLTRRKAVYDKSGAYFMLRQDGRDHVAMSSGMSADLLPVVTRLNGVINGDGVASKRLKHRMYTQ